MSTHIMTLAKVQKGV